MWYRNNIRQRLKELTEQALRSPPDDRVVLAESLLLRIDGKDDLLVGESVMAELERGLQEFRDGKVTGIPADKELRRIRETLKSQFVDIY